MSKGHRAIGLAALIAAAAAGPAAAQPYPGKAVRLIVPFPPGGGTDIVSRVLGQKLQEVWGQQILIDNRPGASTIIGSEIVARAAPDGYTMLMASINHTINPSLYPKIPYDSVRDFTPVTFVAWQPLILVTHPALPVRSAKELIALATRRAGELNYASSGAGGPLHLAAELFNTLAGLRMNHIPYKGSGPAEVDLIAGQVQLMFAGPVSALPQVRAGKMRVLAVTSEKRVAALPDAPTIAEAALPGYEAITWWGVMGPAALPRTIVDRWQGAIARALQLPDVNERLVGQGAVPVGGPPEDFARRVREEIEKWGRIVRQANVKVD